VAEAEANFTKNMAIWRESRDNARRMQENIIERVKKLHFIKSNVNTTQLTGQGDELFDKEHQVAALREKQVEQTRTKEDETDYFTDERDGRKYRTVKIGDQLWMAENLNYKTGNSWCYGNDDSNSKNYGRLYNWDTAMTACPAGWRLPTGQEWDKLITEVGGSSVAGKFLKAASGWSNNGVGTDDYRFSALPGGFRVTNSNFDGVGNYGNWWTATEYDGDNAYMRGMHYFHSNVGEGRFNKGCGFSVRYVKN
jgi:uncharacterized protein (TIGR02145 family)